MNANPRALTEYLLCSSHRSKLCSRHIAGNGTISSWLMTGLSAAISFIPRAYLYSVVDLYTLYYTPQGGAAFRCTVECWMTVYLLEVT